MGFGTWLKGLFGGSETSAACCVACDSTALSELAPDVYRCNDCGYEGGDGLAAWHQSQAKERMRTESTAQLLARLHAAFDSARLTLLAAPGAGAPTVSGTLSGSDSNGEGTTITWSVSLGSYGSSSGGPLAHADAEEREMLIQEQKRAVMEARAELVDVLPALELLADKGLQDLAPVRDSVAGLSNDANAGPKQLAAIVSEGGPVVGQLTAAHTG